MSDLWSIEELYRVHFEQVLFEAHSFNCQLSEKNLSDYHKELLRILLSLGIDSSKETLKTIKGIFENEIKKKNSANTSLKRLEFASDKCEFDNYKYHAFAKGAIEKIEVDEKDGKYSGQSPIPGLGIETTLFTEVFSRHGLSFEDLRPLRQKIPVKSFNEVFDSNLQIQYGKRKIVSDIVHETDDLMVIEVKEIDAELFLKAPESVKPVYVEYITDQSLVEVKPDNSRVEIPMLVISKDQTIFEATCEANIQYNVIMRIGSLDEDPEMVSKTFSSSSFQVKITSFGYLFEVPEAMEISSNFILDGPLPKLKRDSFKQSEIVTNTQNQVINAQVFTNKDILHCFCYFRIPTKLKVDLKDNV